MASLHLAVDAMGGDFGLRTTIPASLRALRDDPALSITLVGDREQIAAALTALGQHPERLTIVHAPSLVAMDEKPTDALRRKRDSSMAIALQLLSDDQVAGVVSSGNTGALVAMSCMVVKCLADIRRPAICSRLPTAKGHSWVLDLGANIDCDARQLHQFALMGSALATLVDGAVQPSVGLLNIGTESIKGPRVVQDAAERIAADDQLHYIGFVEGGDLFAGAADVVVCDGFSGNIALKVCEGTAQYIAGRFRRRFAESLPGRLAAVLARAPLARIKQDINPDAHNGAALLGLEGVVVKSHGAANAEGFYAAIQQAQLAARQSLPARLGAQLAAAATH